MMQRTIQKLLEVYFPKSLSFLLAILIGICAFAVSLNLGQISLKQAIGVALILSIFLFAFALRHPKLVFLFFWVFSLTYNRQYFAFDAIFGNNGLQGPYFIVADIFLVSLISLWIYEIVILKKSTKPLGSPLWPWYFPFAFTCLLSVFLADRVDWTIFEIIRVIKVALILFYTRYNLGKREWWVCAVALAFALITQSVLGTLEIVFKKSGVLWLFGLGRNDAIPDVFRPENFYGCMRATGTMNHPPNLACYLLLIIPLFIALGVTFPYPLLQAFFFFTGIAGLIGLACTLSRWPWVLAILQVIILLPGLAFLRVLSIKRALGFLSVGIFVFLLVIYPLRDRIAERMTRDLTSSLDQRLQGNRVALNMLKDNNPFLGIGLNNYRVHMLEYDPDLAWIVANEDIAVKRHLRFIAAPENGFVFVLVEIGIFGLLAFCIYLLGVFLTGLRAIFSTKGYKRSANFGLLLGVIGVLGQQVFDYSYWVDPVLYSFTLIVGMLNNSPYYSKIELQDKIT